MKVQVTFKTDYEATGLVTNKVYADGKGPLYDYTPDGKLAKRKFGDCPREFSYVDGLVDKCKKEAKYE